MGDHCPAVAESRASRRHACYQVSESGDRDHGGVEECRPPPPHVSCDRPRQRPPSRLRWGPRVAAAPSSTRTTNIHTAAATATAVTTWRTKTAPAPMTFAMPPRTICRLLFPVEFCVGRAGRRSTGPEECGAGSHKLADLYSPQEGFILYIDSYRSSFG